MGGPLFLERVETVYSLAQLLEAPDLRPPKGGAPIPRGSVKDPEAAVADLPGSHLPVYRFRPDTAGNANSSASTSTGGLTRSRRLAPGLPRPAADRIVHIRSFGSLTDLEALGASEAAARERAVRTPDSVGDTTKDGPLSGAPRAGGGPSGLPPRPSQVHRPYSRSFPSSSSLSEGEEAPGASPVVSRRPPPLSPPGLLVPQSPSRGLAGSPLSRLATSQPEDAPLVLPSPMTSPPQAWSTDPAAEPVPRVALPPLPSRSVLDRLLVTEWEARAEAGLFRYDVGKCATRLLRGAYGFVAQLNPGRGNQKRPSQVRVDAVDQPWDDAKFNFSRARQAEVLLALQPSGHGREADDFGGGGRWSDGTSWPSGGLLVGEVDEPATPGASPPTSESGQDEPTTKAAVPMESAPSTWLPPRPPSAPTRRPMLPQGDAYDPSAPTPDGPLNLVLINVSPIEYGHVLLVPDALSRLPQRAERGGVTLALELAARVRNPYFRIGFNSLGAYGTINHLHYQAYYLAAPMPVERAPVAEITDAWPGALGEAPPSPEGTRVRLVLRYPMRGVVLEAYDAAATESTGSLATGETGSFATTVLGNAVGDAARRLAAAGIPHNLLVADAGKRVFIFPNVYSQRKARGEIPQDVVDMGVDPACWEISGHLVYKQEADYDAATETKAWNLLHYASLDEGAFYDALKLMFEGESPIHERERSTDI